MKHLVDVRDRVAVVFGAAGGLGSAHARRLATAKAKLILVDRTEASLAPVLEACPGARALALDAADGEAVAALVDRIEREEGPIERAVHAVGIMPAGPALETDPEVTLRAMNVNFGSVVHLAHALLPRMVRRGRGGLVVYGSFSGVAPHPRLSAYCASKAAVNNYVGLLAEELRGTGVRVHLAVPTGIRTPLIAGTALVEAGPRAMKNPLSARFLADPLSVATTTDAAIARGQIISRAAPGSSVFPFLRGIAPGLLRVIYRQMEREPG
jgi:short-subunit dehydrogenase